MAIRNVALLALYNEKKEILMQHRAKDAKRLPDHWGFFGGGIEEGETPEQAVQREIIEELEYNVHSPNLNLIQKFIWEGDENTKYVFIEKYDLTQPLIQHEGQNMAWLSFKDMEDLLIVDHDKETLQKIRHFLEL